MCMLEILFQDIVPEKLQNTISINLLITLWLCNILLSTCKLISTGTYGEKQDISH